MKKLSLYVFLGLLWCNVAYSASPTGLYKIWFSIKLFIFGEKSLEDGFSWNWTTFIIIILVFWGLAGIVIIFEKIKKSSKKK
jgi:hypothetical protein